ncbi:putative white-brown complex 30 [Tetrabaena socialis]|uniref:Putative white-brown complex 30 n=1 Tax=Tetrabaena socialis TaxID=47790 RepID=A0A2J8AK04_9CHLO|nr:putative white-brown complex 30 [Tetrabaena socialis]|eukprot:PNH12855.1 putative white-brown complex 30 [Tetrabaena socialis]
MWATKKFHVRHLEMRQLYWLIRRNFVKSGRAIWPSVVLDVALLQGASFIVGAIQGTDWGLSDVPANFTMTFLVLSVLSNITHLRTFTTFRDIQRRERISGVSILAEFLSSNLTDLVWIFLSPAIYLATYWVLVLPRSSFLNLYLIGVLICWWSAGLSYVVAKSLIPPQAQLVSTVILTLLLGAFLHGLSPTIRSARDTPSHYLEVVLGVSSSRWAMEAATIEEFKHYHDVKINEVIMIYHDIGLCNMDRRIPDDENDDCDHYFIQACLVIFGMGMFLRFHAFAESFFGEDLLEVFEGMGDCCVVLV